MSKSKKILAVLFFSVLVFAIIPIISNYDGTLQINAADHFCLAEPNGDGTCISCGKRVILYNGICGSDGLTEVFYTLYADGELEIDGNGWINHYGEFDGLRGLIKKITFKGNIIGITDSIFTDCINLTSITIPDSVESIYMYAFEGCTSLTDVYIGKNVGVLSTEVFYGCENITSFKISDKNTFYSTDGNILYNFSKTKLYGVISKNDITEFSVPSTVERIEPHAFKGCKNLERVTIPNSVTYIGFSAFYDCPNLYEVFIPGNTNIDSDAFGYYYNALKDSAYKKLEGFVINGAYGSSAEKYALSNDIRFYGHNHSDEIQTLKKNYTCTEDGLVEINCSLCGKYNVILEAKHTDENDDGLCEVCSNERPVEWEGACGENVNAVLYSDGELIIKGTGPMADYSVLYSSTFYNNNIEGDIQEVTITEGVTSIGKYTFVHCENLQKVTMADSVKEIHSYAFFRCYNLGDITIGNGVEKIEENAFFECYILMDVYFGKSVSDLHRNAFLTCTNLSTVSISPENSSFTTDGFALFSRDKSELIQLLAKKYVSSYEVPENVKTISDGAFKLNEKLLSVKISDSVTKIGEESFMGCKNLSSVTFGKGLTEIGASAFKGCETLFAIVIPDGVTAISENVFRDCYNLSSAKFGKNLTVIGAYSFGRCQKLSELTFGDKVKTIEKYAFFDCYNIKKIKMPKSVVTIGDGAFMHCDGLTDVEYTGDTPDWNKIIIGADNEKLTSAKLKVNHTHTVVIDKAVDATCTKSGLTEGKHCSQCNEIIVAQQVVVKKAHTPAVSKAVDATCTSKGKTEGKYCSVCKTVLAAQKEIPAKGHKWGNFTVTKTPTAAENGVETRTCSVCKSSETRTVPQLSQITVTPTSDIKKAQDQPELFALLGTTVEELKKAVTAGIKILDAKGNEVTDPKTVLSTGMKIVIKDGNKVIAEITVVVPGDIDGDGKVSASDARLALRNSVKLEVFKDYQSAAADMDEPSKENSVTASDARFILRTSVGLEKIDEWFKNKLK